MFRNALIAFAALVATAGTFGGTTSILTAGVTAPVAVVA
jgi:hypothetical protein